jgi:hypothetical protein
MTGKSRAPKPALSLSATLEILRRAQHQDALDPLAVEMREVPRVAGQKIVRLKIAEAGIQALGSWEPLPTGGPSSSITGVTGWETRSD